MERSHFMVAVAVTMAVLSCCAGDRQHKVGGRRGRWAPNVNFTEWAAGERFYVGDWLVFLYEKGSYDVVQVNATDYELCSAEHPISSYAKGKSYAFQLNHTGSYHFICSRGQCWSGMKLAIHVDDSPLPAPAPAPAPSLEPSAAVSASASLATALLVAASAAISVVTSINVS